MKPTRRATISNKGRAHRSINLHRGPEPGSTAAVIKAEVPMLGCNNEVEPGTKLYWPVYGLVEKAPEVFITSSIFFSEDERR